MSDYEFEHSALSSSLNDELKGSENEKRERLIMVSDYCYNILCMADTKTYDPSQGLENLAMMYASLAGPLDFDQLAIERARAKAKQMNLF